MLEFPEFLQRWEDDGGALRPSPLPPSREDDNEIYISDRWCLAGGPGAQAEPDPVTWRSNWIQGCWDRLQLRETFLSISGKFLGSPDAVLDFLLNTGHPNAGNLKRPFVELKEKLIDLRNKARQEGNQAVELHSANLENQCEDLLNRGGANVYAVLRVDHTRHDWDSCARVIAEQRFKAYEWLKMRNGEQLKTVFQHPAAGRYRH